MFVLILMFSLTLFTVLMPFFGVPLVAALVTGAMLMLVTAFLYTRNYKILGFLAAVHILGALTHYGEGLYGSFGDLGVVDFGTVRLAWPLALLAIVYGLTAAAGCVYALRAVYFKHKATTADAAEVKHG